MRAAASLDNQRNGFSLVGGDYEPHLHYDGKCTYLWHKVGATVRPEIVYYDLHAVYVLRHLRQKSKVDGVMNSSGC